MNKNVVPDKRNDKELLHRAIALADTRSESGANGPFGAVVAKNATVVGEGWNRVVETSDPSAHAEIVAIREACARLKTHVLKGCTLYSSCEPCPMCLAAAYWARIDRIVYACTKEDAAKAGFDDSLIYREIKMGWGKRSITSARMSREQGVRVLKKWVRNPRKLPY
jgi:tRNA(Arg) A34 adenosine deaminase TadA